jgi:hypothetical protein
MKRTMTDAKATAATVILRIRNLDPRALSPRTRLPSALGFASRASAAADAEGEIK